MPDSEEIADGDVDAWLIVPVPEDAEGHLSGKKRICDFANVVDGKPQMGDGSRPLKLRERERASRRYDPPVTVVAVA